MHEPANTRASRLADVRLRCVWWMKRLVAFHPTLVGSVWTGETRQPLTIDLHLFAGNHHSVASLLDDLGFAYEIEDERRASGGQKVLETHFDVRDEYPLGLTVHHPSLLGDRFRNFLAGQELDQASVVELECLIANEHGVHAFTDRLAIKEEIVARDRFQLFQSLLLPLENVKQSPRYHPEGDALFHSLQVYGLACDERPYDEEFLLAALLHDVGKAIDRDDHVTAGLEALDGFITERTRWLIEHHMEAHQLHDQTIGGRRRKKLRSHPFYEDLRVLGQCDRDGRVPGVEVEALEHVLDYIKSIGEMHSD